MDTKSLERFATQARRELLTAVDAQAAAVLAAGSVARSERVSAVKKLEAEIDAIGHAHVIDMVAYTWFNRIIALRFMDANGYTDAGVVSPAQGQAYGQPEVLADAKRGNLDPDVVINKDKAEEIIGLLDGTRRSTDAEGEAYALLLTEYCRYWHKSMPFMFEGEGDYTELLVPTGLLADGAILSQARDVLTEEVCNDVEVIGWLYQFYISERKKEVFAGFKKNKKAGADEIPAATQLFTPHWIVRYLVENSLGRLWMLNRPDSRLVERMDYYVPPVDQESDFLKIAGPEELTVIDPACGSGHMLTYSFDLLYSIYEEEGYAPSDIPGLILNHNLYGTEIDPRAGSLAAFALTMKARAKQRTFFNRPVQPNICVIEPISFEPHELDFLVGKDGDHHAQEAFWNQFAQADILGALVQPNAAPARLLANHAATQETSQDLLRAEVFNRAKRVVQQAEYLLPRYAVSVANPPYMGRGNMGPQLIEFVDAHYPNSSGGLDACFISRAGSLVKRGGMSALVTMQSWMYLSSFEQLRRQLLKARSIATLCHLGTGVFDSFGGEVVAVVGTVFRHTSSSTRGTYLRLIRAEDREAALRAAIVDRNHTMRFERTSTDFLSLRGALLVYFADQAISEFLAGTPIRNHVVAGVGSQTGDNQRFVRYWFEVPQQAVNMSGRAGVDRHRWSPTTKGGEFRRWYDPTICVMDWRGNGDLIKRESSGAVIRNAGLYFHENLSWSKIGTKSPSFRFSSGRVVHNDASCFLVAGDVPLDSISAYLNSRTIAALVKELNPTLNLRPSALLDFPFVSVSADYGATCRNLSKRDWDSQELSMDFRQSVLLEHPRPGSLSDTVASTLRKNAAMTAELATTENTIEQVVARSAGLPTPDDIPWDEHSLLANPKFRYGPGRPEREYSALATSDTVRDFVSYAVGCMFGRYTLDKPGLILADQGSTVQDYLTKVPSPMFMPDADNVIPFVDDGWFEDDIVERFRQFLRAAFDEEHFEENLRFVEESLGVKTLRDYFITKSGKSKFYEDHVQRYKKRPIYWMFSSPKGSFNALIYMHRYNTSTVSTVLNEYLREYRAKLEVALFNAEQAAAAGSTKEQKEADRLRKVLAELRDYEHDVLYPLAAEQIAIDLDDGVKANYPKFYPALKRITGLEAAE